jgi:hypothetical protein
MSPWEPQPYRLVRDFAAGRNLAKFDCDQGTSQRREVRRSASRMDEVSDEPLQVRERAALLDLVTVSRDMTHF